MARAASLSPEIPDVTAIGGWAKGECVRQTDIDEGQPGGLTSGRKAVGPPVTGHPTSVPFRLGASSGQNAKSTRGRAPLAT